jgi:uncharacterized damage-inducible protein DinB
MIAIGLVAIGGVGPFALAQGQTQAPTAVQTQSQELLNAWNSIHTKLINMAQDFPENKYDYKLQKDQRTFAENLLHVAGADYLFLSAISGKDMKLQGGENPPRSAYKSKADIVALMKKDTADGAALIQELGDAGLNKQMKFLFGNMMVHVSYAFWDIVEHAGEHYGQLVVYYRANNLVPPASRQQ